MKFYYLWFIVSAHITTSTFVPEMRIGTQLTWAVETYPPMYLAHDIDAAIRRGFGVWTKVCNVNFEQVKNGPNIIIKFASRAEHQKLCRLEMVFGIDTSLYQSPAQIHVINNDVIGTNWTLDDNISTKRHRPLSQLMAHEVGHVLGFSNITNPASIMFESGLVISELHPDDVSECRTRYGSKPPIRNGCALSASASAVHFAYPDRTFPQCAVIFSGSHCDGTWWRMPLFAYPEQRNATYHQPWSKQISSFEINPGCKIKLCTETNYSGQCLEEDGGLHGKNVGVLNETFDNNIDSLSCTCGERTDQNVTALSYVIPGGWYNVVMKSKFQWQRGTRVPANFSGNDTQKVTFFFGDFWANQTCGVLVEQFSVYGRNLLMHHGAEANSSLFMEFLYRIPNIFTYVGTRPTCTLNFCQNDFFHEPCEIVEPNQHLSRDFIFIKSFRCLCNDTAKSKGHFPLTTAFSRL